MIKNMDWFIDNLKNNIPFAYARFNDGEMGGIQQVGFIAARGDQYVDTSLSTALKEAISHKQKNYYIGIPCSLCFPEYNKLALDMIGEYEYITHAVATTNRNWKKFIDTFPMLIKNKRLVWVSGKDQNTEALQEIGITVDKKGLIPNKNSWRYYEHVLETFPKAFQPGDIVCISLGPTARILARKWFERYPDITFIDIGSNFDPFTRNVRHRCHMGWEETGFNISSPCAECN